ncbi:MAG: hypothetical protein PHV82_11700, partial [Victivallaceae bacterium]|nr:hypothetical protein [Victivallaceae bacterium]
MPLYECCKNAENRVKINDEQINSVRIGKDKVISEIVTEIRKRKSAGEKTVVTALDGWYGVFWKEIISALKTGAENAGLNFEIRDICS